MDENTALVLIAAMAFLALVAINVIALLINRKYDREQAAARQKYEKGGD